MKRLSKNIVSLFSADMARRLLGFISVLFLARILGKEGFGAVNLGFAVLSYAMVLSAAGFPMLGAKKIAQGESPELIGQVIGSRLIATILVLTVVILAVLLTVHDATIAWLIILLSCAVLPQIFFLDWFFQGKETMEIVSVARVVQAVIYLAVVIYFVRTTGDILWVAIGSIAGESTSAVLLFKRFRQKYQDVRIRIVPSLQLLRQALPLSIGIILSTFVVSYPQLVIGILNTTSDVGIYSAASKLVYFLLMGDRILVLLLLPASARKYTDSPEAFSQMLSDAIRWILLLGLPIAVGGMLVAGDLIKLVFGIEYGASVVVLKVLIWYFFLTMLHTTYIAGLISAGGEKSYGKIMLATAIAYLLCVSTGAFWFGPIGAAFGVVLAEGFSVVLISRALRRFVVLPAPERLLRVVISIIMMAVGVACVIQYGLLWAILMGAGSYCALLFFLRAVVWNDVAKLLARF
jgi:O-antigen/teichoic acid export membrane protein